MKLTTAIVEPFIGGQIEIQNSAEGYIYRGEIKTIAVEGEGDEATLDVILLWQAKGEGFPPAPSRWVNYPGLYYSASLIAYAPVDIGSGRICLDSSIIGETVVLFPHGGSTLDPSTVEGLELATIRR